MRRLSSLIRWSGPATVLGAVVLIVHIALSFALGPDRGTSSPYEVYNPLLYVVRNLRLDAALLLFVVGLAGLYARQAEAGRSGWLGRASLFLALSAGALVAVGIVAAAMVGLWPGLSVPVAFYTQLLAAFCLVAGLALLGIAARRPATLQQWIPRLQEWIPSIRWRWALLILAAGLGAALLSDVLEQVMVSNIPVLNIKGTHIVHVLLTIPVAVWVARRIAAAPVLATAPVLYGILVGLVSGIVNQIYFHILVVKPGTLDWSEVIIVLPLSIAAGWLGGIIAQLTLAGQEMLYWASRAVGEASDPQEIVEAIGERLTDPQVSHVALWQPLSEADDGTPTELSLLAVWMPRVARVWGPGVWRPGLRLSAAQLPVLANLEQRSPLVLRVRKLPASERTVWEHQGIRSAVLLPLINSAGAQVGLLMIASRRTYGFSKVNLRTYLTIAAQVALVLENFRLVERAQQVGVSNERQRLSREIHDTLAQGFTSIVMNLEAAEAMLPSGLSSAQQFLDQARSTARDSLAEARRLMWALRPESLERASLPEALARLAESWSEESGATASATVTGTPHPVTPEIEVTLLRVAQEALTNCRKYSQASQVMMTLSYMNNLVTLNVQDNGVGFDPTRLSGEALSAQSTGGFGLKGMRERVEQLRGTLLVESEPGEGTTLMVAIPVVAGKRVAGSTQAVRETL